MITSKLTSKHQATIPAEIRKKLGLHGGDLIAFELVDDAVVLRRVTPLDLEYARAVQATLGEWNSDHDVKAYRDL